VSGTVDSVAVMWRFGCTAHATEFRGYRKIAAVLVKYGIVSPPTTRSGDWPPPNVVGVEAENEGTVSLVYRLIMLAICCASAASVSAQKASPSDETAAAAQEASTVREIGGRLVTTGETVVVKGELDEPVRDSSIATKIDTPLLQTPRSITIIDHQTLDDLSIVNITQAHDYAVGMTPQDERGPGFARGFPVDFYDLRRDGLRTYSWSVREPVALERIQYLRGPASILYGDGSPGAMVNLVLNKPMPVRRVDVSGSAGSPGLGRLSADATGPLNDTRTVRYRLIASGEWLENGFDNGERRFTVFPSLAVDLNSKSTLTFDTEIYRQRGRNYRHAVPATADAQRGDFSGYPWDLSVAAPDDEWTGGNVAPGARLDLDLAQNTSLHVATRYTRIDGDIDVQALIGLTADGATALRYHYREISTWDEYQSDAFAATIARTGGIEHKLVGGIEAGLSATDSQIGVGPAAPLDVNNPEYGSPPSVPSLAPSRFNVMRVGLYAMDQMRLSRMVTIVPGLRWSHIDVDDKVAAATRPAAEAASTDSLASPSIGLVVVARPWFSLYSSYTEGFEPPVPGQYLEDGLAPALSENWSFEAGAKADILQQRLSVTGAAFRIRRTNVPEADPQGFYRQIGEGQSHGLELEAVGMLAPGLTTRTGYAWTQTEITRDSLGATGRELPNAPRHKANLWMRYRFAQGAVSGLMLAGGMVYESNRFTNRDNVVTAPAYTRFDASTSWPLPGRRLTLGMVAENLTNLRYVRSGAGGVLFAGPPRRLAVQMSSSF
jgi:iron complex outermembrane receptor protein